MKSHILRIQDNGTDHCVDGCQRTAAHLNDECNDKRHMGQDQAPGDFFDPGIECVRHSYNGDEDEDANLNPDRRSNAVTADIGIEACVTGLVRVMVGVANVREGYGDEHYGDGDGKKRGGQFAYIEPVKIPFRRLQP